MKTETKQTYTPGPWEATDKRELSDTWGRFIEITSEKGSVAKVYKERNAHLIAAAPDILSILKAIAEQFNNGADKVYSSALSPHSDDVTLGEWINEAIAKAEGNL